MNINNKNMKKIIFLIAIVPFLNGCVSLPSETTKTFMDESKKEGMIVGTISLEDRKSIASGHYFYYANDSIKNKLALKEYDAIMAYNSTKWKYGIIIRNSEGDFTEDKKWGYMFTIVKPEGKYNFYEIEIFLNSGYMQSTWKIPINLPFEIEAGKVKYIGEINLKVKKGELNIIDKIERDRMKFKEKFPNISF